MFFSFLYRSVWFSPRGKKHNRIRCCVICIQWWVCADRHTVSKVSCWTKRQRNKEKKKFVKIKRFFKMFFCCFCCCLFSLFFGWYVFILYWTKAAGGMRSQSTHEIHSFIFLMKFLCENCMKNRSIHFWYSGVSGTPLPYKKRVWFPSR